MEAFLSWAWIPITIWAAACQTVRTALQKQLKGRLGTGGATFVRFLYGMPLALIWLLGLRWAMDLAWPQPDAGFFLWMAAGAIAQILATALLIVALNLRNFVVGTAYSKTETLQAAILGIVMLGEPVTAGGAVAILIGTVGVMMISLKSSDQPVKAFLWGWTERSALIGIASGTLFAGSAISFRAASLSLEESFIPLAAAYTLACATALQTTVMAIWLAFREAGELRRSLEAWRPGLLVGITSAAGSVGWFTAMALQVAAYVRMLGMVEIVFTFLVSYLAFRERPSRAEISGVLLLVGGILLALATR